MVVGQGDRQGRRMEAGEMEWVEERDKGWDREDKTGRHGWSEVGREAGRDGLKEEIGRLGEEGAIV